MSNDISNKIRNLRALHHLTLEDVASCVGVGKSTVRKWETGQISNMRRDKIAKLASALHTTPGYLMGWEESPATQFEQVYTADEKALLANYRSLNAEGQAKARSYIADLALIYKNTTPNAVKKQA